MANKTPIDELGDWLTFGLYGKLSDAIFGGDEIQTARKDSLEAIRKAMDIIQGNGQLALGLQKPFLEGGTQDYQKFRGLVNSGYFQQPYGQSFTSQQAPNNGFTFNPKQGNASFGAFQPTGGPATFTPQALPPMPQGLMGQAPNVNTTVPQAPPQAPAPNLYDKIMELLKTRPASQLPPPQIQPPNGLPVPILSGAGQPMNPGNPSETLIGGRTGWGPGYDPRHRVTVEDVFRMMGRRPGGSGPYGLMAGA